MLISYNYMYYVLTFATIVKLWRIYAGTALFFIASYIQVSL